MLGTADVDAGLKQYSCCLLYQCLLTDSFHYVQRLVHADDGRPPLMCAVLSYLVDHDCEWGSVDRVLLVFLSIMITVIVIAPSNTRGIQTQKRTIMFSEKLLKTDR